MTDYRDRNKPITAEDLIRRYNFEDISKIKKATQNNKDSLDKTNTIMQEFIQATTEDIQELQDQVDGNITTWFYSGVPTLSNQPAVDWTTDEMKANHLGDMYYDQDTGYAYRFSFTENTYQWVEITDSAATEALAIANAAKDTADSKRRVFVSQPTIPYDIGDLWIRGDQDLYRCQRARNTGQFDASDFVLATKYTDDTVATQALAAANATAQDVAANYVTNTTLQTTVESVNASVSQVAVLANSKNKVFTTSPTPPYNIGDIRILNDKIYVCTTAKALDDPFDENDWTLDLDTSYYVSQTDLNLTNDKLEAISSKTQTIDETLQQNVYTKQQVDQLLVSSETGLTNTFSEAGGNNILKNTNFSAKDVLEVGQHYEYWYGNVDRLSNNNAVNRYSVLLKAGSLMQTQPVADGPYTFSFYYKKLNTLAKCYITIDDGTPIELTNEDEYTLFQTGVKASDGTYIVEPINASTGTIKVEFSTDINDSLEVYDIMLNYGTVKLAYSQNQNEVTTDSVNISKGISIISSESPVKFVATNEDISFRNKNTNDKITEFDEEGIITDKEVIRKQSQVVGIFRQKVGNQVWDSLM